MSARARVAVAAAPLLLTTGCTLPRFWLPGSVTEEGDAVTELWRWSFVAAFAVGALVYALILYTMVRYRKRSEELPRQVEYHVPLEITYTLVPVLIIAVLFAFTYTTQRAVLDPQRTARDPVEIGVVGFKWGWRFEYAGGVTSSAADTLDGVPEVVVPVGRPVRFALESPDVIHSFFVPRFLFKQDVIPGRDNVLVTTVTEEGTFMGHCAEFCGVEHDQMTFRVRAVPAAEFDRWLAGRRGAP